MNNTVNRWYTKSWVTAGSRFNAYERLKRQHFLSTLTVGLLSAYVVILNLFVFIDDSNKVISDNSITILTIVFSIVIIVVSNLIYSQDYKLKSNLFHECGKEINKMHHEFSILKDKNETDEELIKAPIEKYNSIIDKYDINHSDLDFKKFKRNHVQDFEEEKEGFQYDVLRYVKHLIKYELVYYLMLIIPPLLMIFKLIKTGT